MDLTRRDSGHLMLITPERVFYAGLLGRPRQRCSGAFHVYVALTGNLRLTPEGGEQRQGELLVVSPNAQHTIESDYRTVIVRHDRAGDRAARDARSAREPHHAKDPASLAFRIRAAYEELLLQPLGGDISNVDLRPHVLRRRAAATRRSIRA